MFYDKFKKWEDNDMGDRKRKDQDAEDEPEEDDED
jgi:hypothetical protein